MLFLSLQLSTLRQNYAMFGKSLQKHTHIRRRQMDTEEVEGEKGLASRVLTHSTKFGSMEMLICGNLIHFSYDPMRF
jgi:hypothetical protein